MNIVELGNFFLLNMCIFLIRLANVIFSTLMMNKWGKKQLQRKMKITFIHGARFLFLAQKLLII